ncbi:MAG: ArsA family ATPase [Vicinamibacterales bacterium]
MNRQAEERSFVFVGGKGGVGKTTCAAILAMASARERRTLLVTTDPASSLASVLGAAVGPRPAPVRGAPGLLAANVDSARAFTRWLRPRRKLLADIALEGTYLDSEDVERLLNLSLPGVDEVIGLLEVMQLGGAGRFERIVVDTAPTGHTLRLLSSPLLFSRLASVLDALQSHHRAVVSALRGAYAEQASDRLVESIAADAERLSSVLRDPRVCAFCWVTLPEPASLEETWDAITTLERSGLPVRRLIVNRVTPAPSEPCEWCEGRRRFESRALAPVARRFHSREITVLSELEREPRGMAALKAAVRRFAPFVADVHAPAVERRLKASLGSGARTRSFPTPRIADLVSSARLILFGGKGGVGKSTCAAAAAIQIARARPDARVLLLSTDPAHSLGDVFGVRLGDDERRVRGAPANLRAREIDAAAGFATFRKQYLGSIDTQDRAPFRQLIDLAPPGVDELISVADVAAALTVDGVDVVVADTAPTGHALRLLQTPAVLRDWTQALMALLLKYRAIVNAGALGALLVETSKRVRMLQSMLVDPAETRFVVVTRAAAVPMAETDELLGALRALRIAAPAIVVNALGAGRCARCRRAVSAQRKNLARLTVAHAGRRRASTRCAIIEAPAEVPPPHGVRELARWSGSWRRIPS